MSGSSDDTNLIVNYIPQTIAENELKNMFTAYGEVESCKILVDKQTGHSLGYGFVKFKTTEHAEAAIAGMNGFKIHNKTLKVSVARPPSDEIKHANLYVSGLSHDITREQFEQLFSAFGTIVDLKLLQDQGGNNRGVGFVRYDKRQQAEAAIQALNGAVVLNMSTPIEVKFSDSQDKARRRGKQGQMRYQPYQLMGNNMYAQLQQIQAPQTSPSGYYCLFVYNLPSDTDDNLLFRLFGPFGAVVDVKVIRDLSNGMCKGFGFVNMLNYQDAQRAIMYMNGYQLGNKCLQVSFKANKSKGLMSGML